MWTCIKGAKPKMRIDKWGIAAIIGLALILKIQPARASSEINMYLFYSPECPHCQVIRMDFLPTMSLKYDLKVKEYNADNLDNYKLLLGFQKQYQGATVNVPVIVIGKYYLTGEEQVKQKIPAILEEYKQKGGVKLAALPPPINPVQLVVNKPITLKVSRSHVYLAYFYRNGCAGCERIDADLARLEGEYPDLKIRRMDMESTESVELNQALCLRYKIPEEITLSAPLVFIGRNFLSGTDIRYNRLKPLFKKYWTEGLPAPWEEISQGERQWARRTIISRFTEMSPVTVIKAGLSDGLVPCALSAAIFLLLYLGLIYPLRRWILPGGSICILAVFAASMLASLRLGFFISSLELGRTGQVYLPTMMYIFKLPGFTTRVLYYLALYNLCFITPLLTVFMLIYVRFISERESL